MICGIQGIFFIASHVPGKELGTIRAFTVATVTFFLSLTHGGRSPRMVSVGRQLVFEHTFNRIGRFPTLLVRQFNLDLVHLVA